MSVISKKIAAQMVQNEIISNEEKELYAYGMHQGFVLIVNILTALIIGVIFDRAIEIIIFFTAYMPLRLYAGGYHAKTPLKCYIFSVFMVVLIILITRTIQWNIFIVIPVITISTL